MRKMEELKELIHNLKSKYMELKNKVTEENIELKNRIIILELKSEYGFEVRILEKVETFEITNPIFASKVGHVVEFKLKDSWEKVYKLELDSIIDKEILLSNIKALLYDKEKESLPWN